MSFTEFYVTKNALDFQGFLPVVSTRVNYLAAFLQGSWKGREISSSLRHSDALQIYVKNLDGISVAQGFLAQLYCSRSAALLARSSMGHWPTSHSPAPLKLFWVPWSRALPVVQDFREVFTCPLSGLLLTEHLEWPLFSVLCLGLWLLRSLGILLPWTGRVQTHPWRPDFVLFMVYWE